MVIWKYTYLDIKFCHFCVDRYTNYFKLIFCRSVEYTISYICGFFTFFWNLQIVFSNFLKHQDHWCPGARNLDSQTKLLFINHFIYATLKVSRESWLWTKLDLLGVFLFPSANIVEAGSENWRFYFADTSVNSYFFIWAEIFIPSAWIWTLYWTIHLKSFC